MQKQNLQSSIQKKGKQIQLLQLIFRAIKKFQERKNSRNEQIKLNDLENTLNNL